MKRFERKLLDRLRHNDIEENNEPLKNVRQALGKVGYVQGNPLTKTEIKLNIKLNFFKNQQPITSAALPANLRGKFPVFLFGLTDFYSGFPKSLIDVPLSKPWEDNLNLSYHLGAELVDQANWYNAAYWNTIPPNYTFGGFNIIDTADGNIQNKLIKTNFNWIRGHVYKIAYSVIDANLTGGYEFGFQNAGNGHIAGSQFVNIPLAEPFSTSVEDTMSTIEYYYISSNTNLEFVSGLNLVGQKFNIIGVSIKEVFGDFIFPSDNSVGIYGYNKSFVLSQDVHKGDLVQTFNFINRVVQTGISYNYVDYYTAEVIVHCNNVAFGTFLNSFVSDLITINTLRYVVPIANIAQFINPLVFGYQTLFGKTFTDNIDPRNYITNKDFQQQIADIPVSLPIDKAVMLGTEMDFDCPTFDVILFVEKIEPLTHK